MSDSHNPNAIQLTQYPSGSKREFWLITWPLMLGLLSWTLMLFIDRLFLARWDPLALNAVVTSGLAYYLVLVMPLAIVEISEVLTGRLNGQARHSEVGSAAWQMVLFSLALIPFFSLIAWFGPYVLFYGSQIQSLETIYFRILILSAFLQCANIGLLGFFIGIGKVKIVTYAAIICNIAKLIFDYWLIFGGWGIAALGIAGSGIATVFAQVIQSVFLLSIYWNKSMREKYGTLKLKLIPPFLSEGLRIGVPSGLGRCVEILAHFIFFRAIMTVGNEQMTLVAIAQSVYLLGSSVIDSQSKGASTIVANLLGAKAYSPIGSVLKSGLTLHFGYFLIIFLIAFKFPDQIFNLFIPDHNMIEVTPHLSATFKAVLMWVSLFFLFNGFSWIFIGFLTAAKDTRYVFWVCLATNWLVYIPATLIFVAWEHGKADVAWMIVAISSGVNLLFYLFRYLTGKWLKYNQQGAI